MSVQFIVTEKLVDVIAEGVDLCVYNGEVVRPEMIAPNSLYVVEGGDHSLQVTKRQLQASGETQDDVDQRILDAIAKFVNRIVAGGS